jgi:glycosyltransferase involved in cell wall biosynthesis
MKVLIVTQQRIPHAGGLSTHLLDLLAGLRAQGHETRLLHGGLANGSNWSRLLYAGLSLGSRDRYRTRRVAAILVGLQARVREQLSSFGPDVIHCHDPLAGFATARACPVGSIPVVETVHGPALYEYQQMKGVGQAPRMEALILQCEQTAFAAGSQFIAVDSGQAKILREDYGVDPARITVIFNSVNVAEVRALARPGTPLAPKAPFFLVPRRLVPKTGVQFAVAALARMPGSDAHLVIAGDGPLRAELQRQAGELGVGARVRFLGAVPRPQLLPLFARAVGVLVPSVPAAGVVEATSLAVMEAMACGSVAIASAIGGLAELIEDGQTGLLVPPADAAALADALTRVLEDAPQRARLLAAATRKVETDYSTETWLRRVLIVYGQALSQPATAARELTAS